MPARLKTVVSGFCTNLWPYLIFFAWCFVFTKLDLSFWTLPLFALPVVLYLDRRFGEDVPKRERIVFLAGFCFALMLWEWIGPKEYWWVIFTLLVIPPYRSWLPGDGRAESESKP
jgi:hypothetical protein